MRTRAPRLKSTMRAPGKRIVPTYLIDPAPHAAAPTRTEAQMAQLKGSKTEENLKAAFAGESQANRRYLYFASKADVEGQNDVAALFRSTAEGETGHAHGHLEYLEAVGDPATACRSVRRGRISNRRSPAKRTNTPTCIRAWRRRRARKASTKSRTGSRRSRRLNAATRTAIRRRWTVSSTDGPPRAARQAVRPASGRLFVHRCPHRAGGAGACAPRWMERPMPQGRQSRSPDPASARLAVRCVLRPRSMRR